MKTSKIICLIFILLTLCSCSAPSKNDVFFAMDTYIDVTVYGDDNVTDRIREKVKALEGAFSVTDRSSEIYQLNQNGSAHVSQDTVNILHRSKEISELTDGAFDITVYPVISLWGFTKDSQRVPSESEIENALKTVGHQKLSCENSVATIANGKCDLGAIAKGYASSEIRNILKSSKAKSAVISMGGNIMLYGKKPDGNDWNVGIQHPKISEELIGVLKASDVSVVTSGGYQRYFEQDGKKYHHIIDPKTGYPADSGLLSVTIITKDDTAADALATAIFVMGKDKATALWKKERSFDMILVTENSIYITDGIKNSFSSKDENFKINIIT